MRRADRHIGKHPCCRHDALIADLKALVQRYENHTAKRSRYRPKNPDKKPLGDPDVRKMTTTEREKLGKIKQNQAA